MRVMSVLPLPEEMLSFDRARAEDEQAARRLVLRVQQRARGIDVRELMLSNAFSVSGSNWQKKLVGPPFAVVAVID